MKQKRTSVNARCTEEQRNTIDKKAEKCGLSRSEYLLKMACNGTSRVQKTKEDMARCNACFQSGLNELEVMIMDTGDQKLIEKVKELQKAEDVRWRL